MAPEIQRDILMARGIELSATSAALVCVVTARRPP
jgi:hypothetical protein